MISNKMLENAKRYLLVDQQIAQHFVHYSGCIYHHLPFYAIQIIHPYLFQGSQQITIKGWDFNQLGNVYTP